MTDLFDRLEHRGRSSADMYPNVPGHKSHDDTTIEAAESARAGAGDLRGDVLALLKAVPMTADQCAGVLKRSILSIRPRLSELRKLGLILDTGERCPNLSGKNAIIWRAATDAEALPKVAA